MNPDLDPDRRLALAYVPATRRPAVDALWRLDVTLGAVLVTGRDPMVSRIRLAWWRESLEKLDRAPPPAEPVLEALARRVLPEGVTGAQLAEMEQGWSLLTEPHPLSRADLDAYAQRRGGRLFRYAALLLGEAPEPAVDHAGEAWALVDLARRSSNQAEAAAALAAACERPLPRSWPRRLRPIGMLAVLARRDAVRAPATWEPQGSPRRMLRMLGHRLTGH
ncbi:MAG TPA: squalene/phytoene synthase family protein [Allosphingosinicella sp.]|nr:squalene/phytoene synthase family protein [Allosphingosinicella sp.]